MESWKKGLLGGEEGGGWKIGRRAQGRAGTEEGVMERERDLEWE